MAKTTLELSREEWKRYNPSIGLKRSLQTTAEDISFRKKEAWRIAHKASILLKEKFDARKVYLFGSLAEDIGFNKWSDIDLAVVGVPPEMFYSAVAMVTGLSPSFRVDLIDMNDCRSGLKKSIEQNGIEI